MTLQSLLPLKAHSVSYSVNKRTLLNAICLDVASTGITAILGHNGAGKSLLLRVLHGLTRATAGSVNWAGCNVEDQQVRKRQSMVFQKPVLLRRSVAANVKYVMSLGHHNSSMTCEQLLALADLTDKAEQPARTLSGGEQQRLSFIRALASDPAVMFLDEPTANLDPDATLKLERLIGAASDRKVKIFLVTHNVGQARRLAEDVIFLHQGSVVEHTEAERFFKQPRTLNGQSFIDGHLPDAAQPELINA